MNASALILSNDEIFARMLMHNLSYMRIESEYFNDVEGALGYEYDILIADLDSFGNGDISSLLTGKNAVRLEENKRDDGILVIGYSSVDTPEYYKDYSLCSAFLAKPFLISDLKYIIAGYISLGNDEYTLNEDGYESYISRLRRIAEINGKKLDENNKIERELYCDSDSMSAVYGEKKFPLSMYEYKVLDMLISRRGETVSREEISAALGGEESNMCDVYICHLRKKIDSVLGLKLILTVRGKGYTVK